MVDPSQLPVPEDEQFWNSPDGIRSLELGDTLNTNNVLWYFRLSQFFDHTSNNASLIAYGSQLPHNERLALFRSRTVFEDALRTRFPTGIQYVVVEEPKGPGMPWVIQRQNRKGQDVADVEATFYSSGTTFLKAPNLRDVLQARLLSISVHMQAFLDTASQHVHWTPSTGPSYLPPHLNDSSTTSSKPSDSQSQSQFQPQTTTNGLTNASLFHSLHLTNQYGHEYADENPLQGEPGAFVFASTTQQVEARNKAQAAAQTAAQAQIAGGNTATLPLGLPPANAKTEGGGASANASAVNSVAATPRPLEGMASRKGSLVGVPAPPKVKRRKSKGPGSPLTPGATGGPGSLPGPP